MKRTFSCLAGVAAMMLVGASVASAQPQAPEFQAPAKAPGCPPSGTGWAPPGGGWGPISTSDCSIAGSPGWTVGYSYTAQTSNGPTHASAYHFTNANGTNPGPVVWTEFGAAPSAHSGPLAWGNSLANPQMKFLTVNVLGTLVDWSA